MVGLFRGLVLFAPIAVVGSTFLPFERPLQMNLPLDGVMPILGLLSVLFGVVGGVLGLFSVIGLLRFRRWARMLAVWCAIALALSSVLTLTVMPLLDVMAPGAIALLVLAAICWIGALVLARMPPLAARFEARR
ncbi:hypothetical protein [Luteimonas panaciterrae]|uniref:hypothetical protein n=1 Tax=Luteimonas panaciterrae TaxID=363885 RepID=UPI001CFACB5F|nr:hypothetical protein [Luteimonas panaciterrae]